MENQSTGRYFVGERLFGISFHYDGKVPGFVVVFPYLRYMEDPSKIDIIELTVNEHHKVCGEYDDNSEKKYDGYILADKNNNIWYNQYPVTSYVQISDENNCIFTRHAKTDEEVQKIFDSNESPHLYLLTEFYRNLSAGIKFLSNLEYNNFEERLLKLKNLQQTIEKTMKDEYSLVFKSESAFEDHPDIVKYILVEEQ